MAILIEKNTHENGKIAIFAISGFFSAGLSGEKWPKTDFYENRKKWPKMAKKWPKIPIFSAGPKIPKIVDFPKIGSGK
mgnify:CR=1 FL=1